MKSLIVSAALLAAASSFATDCANTFGVMKIDSGTARTVVAIPWAAVGGGDIQVADVVKTDNLKNGDELYYYNLGTQTYQKWILTDGSWVGVTSVGNSGLEQAVSSQTLTRGGALVLLRIGTGTDLGQPFYVFGQVPDSTTSTTLTAFGGGAYNLLACPKAQSANYDVNSSNWSNVWTGDNGRSDILVINGAGGKLINCFYRGGRWKYAAQVENPASSGIYKTEWTDAPAMEAGTGFWYISYGATAPSVTW